MGLRHGLVRGLREGGIVVLAILTQTSLVSLLPTPISAINVLVALVIYRTLTRGVWSTLPYALTVGLIADLYAPHGFGVSAWGMIAAVLAVWGLGETILTNRTVPALVALGIVGSLTAAGAFRLLSWGYTVVGISPWATSGLFSPSGAGSLAIGVTGQVTLLVMADWWRRRSAWHPLPVVPPASRARRPIAQRGRS